MPNGETNNKNFWKEQGKMEQSIDHLSENFQSVIRELRRIEVKHDKQTEGLYERISLTDAENRKEHEDILNSMNDIERTNITTSTKVATMYSIGISLVIAILSAVVLISINGG